MPGAWTRKEGKNPSGGLNEKGRASLRAEGRDIKKPVSRDEAQRGLAPGIARLHEIALAPDLLRVVEPLDALADAQIEAPSTIVIGAVAAFDFSPAAATDRAAV